MIELKKNGKIAKLIINRPPANSYEINFLKAFAKKIEDVNDDTNIKVILICSASEKFFMAGADIKVFEKNDIDSNKEMVVAARKVCSLIHNSPKIFIASIKGHALGGGLELAMACDFRLAAEGNYLLGLPEIKLGLMPGNGGTIRLLNLIGTSKGMEMLISGEPIHPQEAKNIGLINQLYTIDEFETKVEEFVEKISKSPSLAMSSMKNFANNYKGLSFEAALDLEKKLVDALYSTDDAKEGLQAFKEKRQANFK